jgi:hypothetical protein
MTIDKPPWFETDVKWANFQERAWRNGENGEVLVVEEQHPAFPHQELYHVVKLDDFDSESAEPNEVVAENIGDASEATARACEYLTDTAEA